MAPERGAKKQPRTIADQYDAELRRHHARFMAATRIGPTDRVLDVGCGAGQTTREAARLAVSGSVLGVDVSESMLERARRLSAAAGIDNVFYELGDIQVHPLPLEYFDVVNSRFGTMFFEDPIAAFRNIARAARPQARLVMLVWQAHERNQWSTALQAALSTDTTSSRQDPFSLGDPATASGILEAAGFSDVGFEDVQEPVFYGANVETALDIVCSMRTVNDLLTALGASAKERARTRLRALLAAHAGCDGIEFDSRAWLITARRGQATGVPV
jgi:ubiquinone/menaquinone biosynthesis C-methylase UbiE